MQSVNLFRNPNGDFELIFPLIDIALADESFVTGKASELDSNTVIIIYHNATVWTTASFASGTPVEIGGSTGVYHITILNSWFTARDEDYPIFIKIEDDAGSKTWKTIPITIEGKLKLEKLELEAGNVNHPSMKVIGLELESSTGQEAFNLRDPNGSGCLNLFADGNSCINIDQYDDSYPGILIGAEGDAVQISSWNKKGVYIQGFDGSAVKLEGYGTEPVLDISAEDNQTAMNIQAQGTGKAINVENNNGTNPAFDINNAGAGKDINATELSNLLKSTDSIDGTTVSTILSIMKAAIIGRYKKDTPSSGQLTFYANDNTTPLAIVTLTDTERTRDLPV